MGDFLYGALQAIFGSLVWDLVLASLVAAVITYLRKTQSTWATPLLYFVLSFMGVFVIAFTLTGKALLLRERPQTTPENVESNIKAWADKFSLGIQKGTDNKFSFVYSIALPSGRMVLVGRPKEREGYLQFQGNMQLSPEHEAAVKKISSAQQVRISDEISLELARSKIGWAVVGAPFKGIVVSKAIPITSNLTEDSFIASLDEMDSSILLAREAIRLAFLHNGVPDIMPHPVTSQ